MEIETVVTGALDENCYILKKNNTCLVIDPGSDYPKIKERIGNNKILGVLITHAHFDHVGALRNFLTKRSIKIFKKSNCNEEKYTIGDFNFEVIYTPGHANDQIAFYFAEDKAMFSGDFIFKESIGRCDLPGGSEPDMAKSLEKVKTYAKDIVIYPGHGDKTTIGYELENNEFLR